MIAIVCCYSGAAKLGKGHEEDLAKIGTSTIDNKAILLSHKRTLEQKLHIRSAVL